MSDVILYEPKLTTLKVGAVITTPSTASSFYTQVTDTVTGGVTKWLKDVTVSGVDSPVDLVNFMGQDSNTFQNQALEAKPFGLVKFTATMAISPVDTNLGVGGLIYGITGTTLTADGKRYQYGKGARASRAFALEFSNGANYVRLGFNNCLAVKFGDLSQASDTHLEAPIEVVCLTKDFYDDIE
jgi:hypothetical protein